MILRGGKQLEGPKGRVNDVSLHDKRDEHDVINENEVSVPPSEVINDVHKSKEPLKDSNVASQNLITHLCRFVKRWLRKNLICNLGSS